ncbi:MAG TPA: GreA/GreB family elongation factor [Nocardioides sp.]|uniref:GreA/GreB family elongation factor n=1 Tax=Nocardioides sp. TaxID=35761 RepID=UPI002B7E6745|nr:GreA/GreB family elongation factor [Nocardioides sp.]HTW14082.1 GreA/GreB family elongation factor [Nocardioides sp.]
MSLTSATSTSTPSALLAERLEALRAEREQVLAESRLEAVGDVADRATNVEATIRAQVLDERIAAIELEIEQAAQQRHTDGVVSVGDRVTLDLGDGPESYLIGSVEQAVAGVDTVTPASPLGQAIVGAEVGATVTYSPRPGVKLTAVVVAAETP